MASKAFGDDADSRLIVACQSHQDALRFLSSSLAQSNGVAMLQGPRGSGKTTVVKEQLDWSARDAAVALVNGVHVTPRLLLRGMLSQFGVQTGSQHDEHLLQLLSRFLTEETRRRQAPVLFLDDADRATPSALRLLNWMAALDVRGTNALRIVLTGKERLPSLLNEDGMRSLARRHAATFSLNPMTLQETTIYLRTRLIAAGGESSDKVFPVELCEKLHELSLGWPGALNDRAIDAMRRIDTVQEARPVPRVLVTRDGVTTAEFELSERQYMIGRTELADIVIEDSYVSKMHAMLQVYANAVVLLDLNSTNGTTVNSRVVEKAILRNDDVISLGHYRLKVENLPPLSAEMDQRIKATDTVIMQKLEDVRRSRARRTVVALKHR